MATATALEVHALDEAFDRDRFLLVQKRLAINEKYFISDDNNHRVLFVERPQHVLKQLVALSATIVTVLGVGIAGIMPTVIFDQWPEGVKATLGLGAMLLGAVAGIVVFALLYPMRHVSFYRDDTRKEKLLSITQDNRVQILFRRFSVLDESGAVLARMRKNQLTNLFRKQWDCQFPDGRPMCVAMEDSVILAILRRLIGPLFGALRTNYIILAGDGFPERQLGKFDRRFTLFDQYVLDMTADPLRELDRRVVLAVGVLLDTGERR